MAYCISRGTITNPTGLRTYECDGLLGYRIRPRIVVLPGSTDEVAACVRLAREHGVEKREEELFSRVRAELNSHWVTIEDTKTKEMSRYGDVAADMMDALDPELDRLAGDVLALLDSLRSESR